MKPATRIQDLREAVSRAGDAANLCYQFCPGSYSADLVSWLGLTKSLVDRLSLSSPADDRWR
jgi:hypothetical protein